LRASRHSTRVSSEKITVVATWCWFLQHRERKREREIESFERMAACSIVWFRRDLRLEDNPALIAAARIGSVIPVFIWCPTEDGQFHPGRFWRWWLKQSLLHLDLSLRDLGCSLIMRKTRNTLSVLLEIVEATGATQVFFNHLYGERVSLQTILQRFFLSSLM
jgi:deoxyribodipyrimidine photolyase